MTDTDPQHDLLEGDNLLEVGHIVRPHALKGEVTVVLTSNRPERLMPGSVLKTEQGSLEVSTTRAHGRRHIVAFTGMTTREQAESLRGLTLLADPIQDHQELWIHELIGCKVVDQFGTSRGEVTHVIANPASDLLELTTGALVPVCFITDSVPGVEVNVDVPDGLFEPTLPRSASNTIPHPQ